jgi:hypothetical protein
MKKTETKYLVSIDVLRAIAILLMIQVHFVENLSPREPSSAGYYDLSGALGMLPAPIFSFLVGLSLWLWMLREKESAIGKRVMRRGIMLFGTGLAFATLIWLPESVFIWDILTLLGASTIIVFALRKLPLWIIVGIIILVLCISPLLRLETGYASHWRGAEYIYKFKMRDVVLGFLLHGYFPLLPWIIFPLLGLVVGRRYFHDPKKRLGGWGLPVTGLCLIGLAGIGHVMGNDVTRFQESYFSKITFYPASTTFVVGSMGIVLLGLWILFVGFDRREIASGGAVLAFFKRYSRFSLTTYIVHHAVHVWPLYLLAAREGRRDPWWYYQDAVSTPTALLLAFLFIAGFYGVLVLWENKRQYIFEGMLRWLCET